jgi:predicted aldo/keto reductase-like oxidoreductase
VAVHLTTDMHRVVFQSPGFRDISQLTPVVKTVKEIENLQDEIEREIKKLSKHLDLLVE